MKIETKLIPKLVETQFDLVKALYEHNPQGKYTYGRPAFCPFHDNTETPSAAIYKSTDDRPDSLYCFAEQRQYTVVDVLGKLLGYNIYEIGHAVWNEMSNFEKKEFLETYSRKDNLAKAFAEVSVDVKTTDSAKLKRQALEGFKYGKRTLNEVLGIVVTEELA